MKVLKIKKGFTLVELIVVIAIIGILSAVLIPSITGYISKAKESAAMQEADFLKLAYVDWTVEKEKTPAMTFYDYLNTNKLLQATAEIYATVSGDPEAYSWDVFFYKATNGIAIKGEFDSAGQTLKLSISISGIPETGIKKFPIVD